MKNYTYEQILEMKEKCYWIIKTQLGDEYLQVFKYHKGDLLPFIHTKVRKSMTTGDMDAVQWDFYKNVFRIIECKRTTEFNKDSQNRLLEFLSKIKIPEYKFNVLKIIGDPPYDTAQVIDIRSGKDKIMTQEELIKFLNF